MPHKEVGRHTASQVAINVALALHSRVAGISPTKVQKMMGGLDVPISLDHNFETTVKKFTRLFWIKEQNKQTKIVGN